MRSGGGKSKALSCRCVVTLGETAQAVIRTFGDSLPFPYSPSGTHTFAVLVNEQAARVNSLDSRDEPAWTIVRRGDTRASSMWDHVNRVSFDFAHEEIQPTRVARPLHVRLRLRKRARRAVATLRLEDARAGAFSHELIFEKGAVLAALAGALFRLLYGGPSCHEDSDLPLWCSN
jgi:hypothetical protein